MDEKKKKKKRGPARVRPCVTERAGFFPRTHSTACADGQRRPASRATAETVSSPGFSRRRVPFDTARRLHSASSTHNHPVCGGAALFFSSGLSQPLFFSLDCLSLPCSLFEKRGREREKKKEGRRSFDTGRPSLRACTLLPGLYQRYVSRGPSDRNPASFFFLVLGTGVCVYLFFFSFPTFFFFVLPPLCAHD